MFNKNRSISVNQAIFFAFILWFAGFSSANALPKLITDSKLSTAGYFTLSWKETLPDKSLLQQSNQKSFVSPRQWDISGTKSFAMSGLPNGIYYYRLRVGTAVPQETSSTHWTNTIRIEVKHHSLQQAFLFFGSGAALFIFLVIFIARKHRPLPSSPL